MSLLNENRWSQMTLTADTVPEQPYLPSSEALRDDLLLAAGRVYFDLEVSRRGGWGAGGYFVMRAGEALGEWSGQLSKQGGLSRRGETVDLDVEWGKGAKAWN